MCKRNLAHFFSNIIYMNLFTKKLVLASAILVSGTQLFSQDLGVIRQSGVADKKVESNFMNVALMETYTKQAPKPIQFIGNRKAKIIPDMDLDPTMEIKKDPFVAKSGTSTMSTIASVAPVRNFNGLNDNSTSIPPDVNGTVGPNHTMVTLNTQVRIQDKNGVNISTVSLNSFWAPIGGLTSTYDPKILYDHVANRWIMVSSAEPQSNNSCTLLAVSKTSDPTQGWNLYKVDVDATNQRWVDFPSIGFNGKWIVVQMNLFAMTGFSATSHQIYVWNKDDVYNNGVGKFTKFEVTNEGVAVACPSIHYDNSTSKMFLLRASTGNSAGKGALTMRTLSGPTDTPVMSNPIGIQASISWATGAGTNGNFNPQLGTTNLINAGDHRMRQVVVRDGRIWAAHAIFLPTVGAQRSSIQWWELDTLGNIIQRSLIDDPISGMHFNYPSIAVNKKNDVIIGFSSFSTGQFASAAYAIRRANDPINTFRENYNYKFGENTYFKDFGAGRNRWGDYSNTVVDPTNDSTFWTIQEYAGTNANSWATWWAEVDPDAQVPDFKADNNYICPGEPVSFTNTSNFTGSNIQWTFTGGIPASSTDANPTVTFPNAGKFKVVLTIDGKTQTREGFVIALAQPIRTINRNTVKPCEGNTITLTASQASATYLWSTGATSRAIQVSQTGIYYCDITAPNGVCSRRSDSVDITFVPLPTVTLDSLNPINPNAQAIQLTGGLPTGGTYAGTGVSNGMFNPATAGLGTHKITYTFVTPEGCSGSASRFIEVTNAVGINSASKILAFNVTPNPSKGLIRLTLTAKSNEALKVSVIDQLGRVVWTSVYDDHSKSITKDVDLSTLPKGSYFVKAEYGDSSEMKKLILE